MAGQPYGMTERTPRFLRFCLATVGMYAFALSSIQVRANVPTAPSAAPVAQEASLHEESTAQWRPLRRSFPLGRSEMEVLLWLPPATEQADAIGAIRQAQLWAERVMLAFDENDASRSLWRLNQEAGQGSVVLPPEVFYVVSEAKRVALLSNGAYDPTAAALDALWDVRESKHLPTTTQVEHALAKTAASDVWLDPASRSARLMRAGQALSVAPLALAYAMDGVAARLTARGFSHYLIVLDGGVLAGKGPPGRKWRLGLQDPRAPGHFALWELSEGALMTTGDYFDFAMVDKMRIHPIVDPRTGNPANGLRSVSLRAKSALEAKALSQAFFVLGPDQGIELLARLQKGEVVWVDAANRVGMSDGVSQSLTYRPPTDGP